ncbi:MAG: hypothetical protein OHK0024_24580 [Thalassobaculales bacterium]
MPPETPRAAFLSMLLAAAVLLLLQSAMLVGWSRDLPAGPLAAYVQDRARLLHEVLERAGLTAPRRVLRRAFDRSEDPR